MARDLQGQLIGPLRSLRAVRLSCAASYGATNAPELQPFLPSRSVARNTERRATNSQLPPFRLVNPDTNGLTTFGEHLRRRFTRMRSKALARLRRLSDSSPASARSAPGP